MATSETSNMAASNSFHLVLASFLLFSIFKGGSAECSLSSITVAQSVTGAMVYGKPEFEVVVSNDCICSQSELQLKCEGFDTAEAVDPAIFRPVGGEECSINGGLPVFQGSPIKFKYAWNTQINMLPVSSQINCS